MFTLLPAVIPAAARAAPVTTTLGSAVLSADLVAILPSSFMRASTAEIIIQALPGVLVVFISMLLYGLARPATVYSGAQMAFVQ